MPGAERGLLGYLNGYEPEYAAPGLRERCSITRMERSPERRTAWILVVLLVVWTVIAVFVAPRLHDAGPRLYFLAAFLVFAWVVVLHAVRHSERLPTPGQFVLRGLVTLGLVIVLFAILYIGVYSFRR